MLIFKHSLITFDVLNSILLKKETWSKIFLLSLILFLLIDTGYTFFQHFTKELDGDLAPIILYAEQYQDLEQDPFGWQVLTEGKKYGGVNRFFIHWYLANYFKTIPVFLQNFISPLNSIYVAAAISKTVVHVGLITLLGFMISGAKRLIARDFLIAAALITPLFQSGGHFYKYIGVVEQSITYSSFYALPLCLLLLFLKPYFDFLTDRKKNLGILAKTGLVLLAIILPFSGPLIPGVVLVIALLLGLRIAQEYSMDKKATLLQKAPKGLIYTFGILAFLSLYSIYIGQNNIESLSATQTLGYRYSRIPVGLYYIFTQKLAFPLLFLMLFINLFFIRKYKVEEQRVFLALKWIGLFVLIYLLLLPLGGFRDYRPNIIRKDTFLPITLALIYLYGWSAFLLLKYRDFKYWKYYLSAIAIFSLIFMYADEADADHYLCQKKAINQIAVSAEQTVKLGQDCTILAWEPIADPEQSKLQSELFQLWNITNQKKSFYQAKE